MEKQHSELRTMFEEALRRTLEDASDDWTPERLLKTPGGEYIVGRPDELGLKILFSPGDEGTP